MQQWGKPLAYSKQNEKQCLNRIKNSDFHTYKLCWLCCTLCVINTYRVCSHSVHTRRQHMVILSSSLQSLISCWDGGLNYISHSPAACLHLMLSKVWQCLPTWALLTLLTSIYRYVLCLCVTSMLLASPCECVLQKSRCAMVHVYGRIVKCQISYLHRSRDAKPLRNNVHMIIYI